MSISASKKRNAHAL